MHSDANTNARVSKLLVGEEREPVAREGLEHLAAFTPLRFEAPPSWLASAIEQAREHGRAGNAQAARQVVANAAAEKHTAVDLGKYRDHVTWVERENARKLSALAWMWHTLRASAATDVALDKRLEQLERFAQDHYGVNELRAYRTYKDAKGKTRMVADREWAEQQTYAGFALPAAWREA